MPKLWSDTIETHRRTVDEAIMEATWALVTERGLLAVTMSAIAGRTGIGRATLYKHFPDVESILRAHHQRHVTAHLAHLAQLRDRTGDAGRRLHVVLEAYALICHHRQSHGTDELAALVHRGEDVARAQEGLLTLFQQLLTGVAEEGLVRRDMATDELASYCLHALSAAGDLPSEAAVRRLVTLTLAGLGFGSAITEE
ncbi:TetR/AcrR family transcriptional regulator [Modestobacter muralis]|uniref:TetR/AcrR family transcriptional regulator n=1 Tax=Modestobacter muralis TaxID=1608614 RepID=A0A6P0EP23_9ACTN|nr:TetR/AcrR family transcriptional regulator [Modestobacter muralis]NEN50139.1 TetR/AcrR family transcriptional regulator [Modestobacter muralis]